MNDYRQKLLAEKNIVIPENEITPKEWSSISKSRLTEDFIREFQNQVDWVYISSYQRLSEDFIREFEHKVDWVRISIHQILSDEFILEFRDSMDWDRYLFYQEASFSIIKKFIFKTEYAHIDKIKHSHLSDVQKQEIEKMLALKYMFKKA